MENALRFVIVFLWCVGFGFFSVMGYLDDTMAAPAILVGLLVGLGVYGAIEWRPKFKGLPSIRGGWNELIRPLYARISRGMRAFPLLCAQILHRTRVYLTNLPLHKIPDWLTSVKLSLHNMLAYVKSINLPTWGSIKKRSLPTSKPSVSSKSLP